ncbi:MAG: 30S ribosomal protein S1, partial [Thermotoga sp.]
TKVKGRITKVLPIGVIVDIEDGVSGFVHVSELSWNFVDNVENLVEMDQEVECVVLSMDKEKRKLGLSLKRAREDPWKKVAEELRVGDKVSGEVVRMIDTGAFVMIDGYGIEAFLPVSQVSMDRVGKIEDILQIGQKIEAKIIRMVYNPENDTRNMVISMKQIQLEKEREEYEKYMKEHAGSTLTLEEFLKEKYG